MLVVLLEILVRVQALSQLSATWRPMGRHPIGPASSGFGEGLANRDVLVPSCSNDSCAGLGAMQADTVTRCMVFPPAHWCGWLPG